METVKREHEIKRPESDQPLPPHASKVFEGLVFDVWHWDQQMFDKSVARFEKVSRQDSVATFPVLDDGRIVLNEQEQPGKKPFISAAGGRIGRNESVLDAATRELLEETGMIAERFVLWKAIQPVSEIEWASYVFVAKGIRTVAKVSVDSGERIKLKYVTFQEFLEIAIRDDFYEKEVQIDIFRALLSGDRMKDLQKLFDPTK